jgi:ParB-like chromosome segregation protein Spo0J
MPEQTAPPPVAVHRVTMIDPARLAAAAYNPRKISARAMEALMQSIRAHGFVEPVVVQREGLIVIGGHQRVEALRRLCAASGVGLPKIPAVLLDVGEREAKRLNVALNRIAGEWDDDALAAVLSSLGSLAEVEVLGMGLSAREVAALLVPGPREGETGAFARSVTLSVRFDTVEERDAAKALLDERAQRTGLRPGAILRELLK